MLWRHAVGLGRYQQMDPPQCFPLAAAVITAINILPSICGQMGQRDPLVQHPRLLDAPPRPAK